jgi:hypothetical protein
MCTLSMSGENKLRNTRMSRVTIKATLVATLMMFAVGVLVILGSRNLARFDAALIGYTFATLFSVFAITYRYAIWLQRPPTALYWRRGWRLFFSPATLWSESPRRIEAIRLGVRPQQLYLATQLAQGPCPLAHHVGLRDGRIGHVPARIRLDSYRDAA